MRARGGAGCDGAELELVHTPQHIGTIAELCAAGGGRIDADTFVLAMVAALNGGGTSESIAPDPLITSRVAAHVGHVWAL